MKCSIDHYEIIRDKIALIPFEDVLRHKEAIKKEGKAKDINMRLRWDCFRATGIKIGDNKGISGLPLYEYMNDSHIDTALRAIMKELGY